MFSLLGFENHFGVIKYEERGQSPDCPAGDRF